MVMMQIRNNINKVGNMIVRFFSVTILLWLCAKAIPDYIDSPLISEKLIESVYYGGRKVNKISYDELKKQNISTHDESSLSEIESSDFNLIHNYYSNYFNEVFFQNIPENEDELFVKEEPKKSQSKDNINKKDIPLDEKSLFSKNLYTLYGNRTIFRMNLGDLESLVKSAILTDGQAVIFWETLLQMKTDRAKIIYGKQINEVDSEFYLFNILALKTCLIFMLTLLLFLITHKLQANMIKNFFFYNLFNTILTIYILDTLYSWKYYSSSSLLFLQLAFCVKYLYDSFICNFGFNKDDYDIFANLNSTKTIYQFILKLVVSVYSVIVIGYLAFIKYPFFFNYILFYVCCIQLLYLISYYLQYEAAGIFQPFKHFMLIMTGLLNFILTNFHRKMTRFSSEKSSNDSFYIVSETFSFVCISYLYEYLFTQKYKIGEFFYEKDSESEDFKKRITAANDKYQEHSKVFTLTDDCLWLLLFIIILTFIVIGISQGKYLIFIFSLHYFKLTIKAFGSLFKIRTMRIALISHVFFFLFANHMISLKTDQCIYEALGINSTLNSFSKFMVKLVGLIFILYIIFSNFDFVVLKDGSSYDESNVEQVLKKLEVSATFEKKKKKKIKTIEISIVKEDRTPFSFVNLICILSDLILNYLTIFCIYFLIKDIEKNYFIIFFYGIILLILLLRTFFLAHEAKNKYEFLIIIFCLFLSGIRLMTLTRYNNILYLVGCIYLFFLILFYSMTYRRNFLVTLVMLIHLYSACCLLASNYVMILMISLVCLPLSSHFEDNKLGCSVLKFFLPGLVILFVQLYGFKNLFSSMLILNSQMTNFLKGLDLFEYIQYVFQGTGQSNEFSLIDGLFTLCLKMFNEKSLHASNFFTDLINGMGML